MQFEDSFIKGTLFYGMRFVKKVTETLDNLLAGLNINTKYDEVISLYILECRVIEDTGESIRRLFQRDSKRYTILILLNKTND